LTSPEAAASFTALGRARFPHRNETHLLLPTAREVTVTQGFDDKLSHRGDWKHALDLKSTTPTTTPVRPAAMTI
jgi:hypothetical protein